MINEVINSIFEATYNFFYVALPNLNYTHDQISDQLNDQLNDQIKDVDLKILSIIYSNTGIKVSAIQEKLLAINITVTKGQIRNSIKRKLYNYIIYKGSKKNGGYYLKDQS